MPDRGRFDPSLRPKRRASHLLPRVKEGGPRRDGIDAGGHLKPRFGRAKRRLGLLTASSDLRDERLAFVEPGSFALPLFATKSQPSPITVFAQVHYPDIWRRMSVLLARRLRVPFHLVVTTSHASRLIARPRTRHLRSIRILAVENRGRDVLPFLRALAETTDFDIGLKIHTKKSPQRADGPRWLAELLESLVPSPKGVSDIVGRMRADPRIGFVAPKSFCLPVRPWVLENGPAMAAVMAAIGHELSDADMADAYFAAGSMFWFRRTALAALAADALPPLFELEQGQLDGTIAHAMERVFPVEARRQGFLTVPMPALLASDPGQRAADIMTAARLHAEEPSFLFPGPYESPPSAQFKPPWRDRLLQALTPFGKAVPKPLRQAVGGMLRGRQQAGNP